jgi:ATP-dependent RNA helicase
VASIFCLCTSEWAISADLIGVACRRPQSLILSPTRELASQTTKTIQAMGEFMKVKAHTCVGGTSLGAHMGSLLAHPCHPMTCCPVRMMRWLDSYSRKKRPGPIWHSKGAAWLPHIQEELMP